jgi:hypothetical protein
LRIKGITNETGAQVFIPADYFVPRHELNTQTTGILNDNLRITLNKETAIIFFIFVRNLLRLDHLKDLRVDGRIISRLILKKQGVRVWAGLNWLRSVSSGVF